MELIKKIEKEFLLIIKSSVFGDSEPDLGEKLMKSMLSMFWESETLPAKIIFMAAGIFLTTENSYVKDILKKYEVTGVKILSCGTCLDYYNRKNKLIIGSETNMKDSVQAMLDFKKVVTL